MSSETLIDTPLKVGDAEPVPEDLAATLRVVAGPDTGTLIGIDEPITLIGRDDDCQLKLDDPRVSGHHAMIYFASGEFRVRDMQSTNGSLLNGSPLTEFAFQDGDDLLVGKSVVRLVVDFRQP
jgi:pSer/pThr/pTyr-binding forkhead associated (FHA) protein